MMRKFLCFLLSAALLLGLSCFAEADSEEDYYVYIGLKYMTNAVPSIELSCPDGFLLVDAGRNGYEVIEDYSSLQLLTVMNSDGRTVLTDSSGNVLIDGLLSSQALISAASDPDDRIIKIGGTSYRDGAVFGSYSSGSAYPGMLVVTNYITLEHYLWGVVNNELGYTNPSEALKAQAVASRSFTLANLNKHGGGALSFDLCFRTHCQAYGGVSSEKPQTTAACMATEGIVIAYGGDVACAYFHAYNGGYTMNAEDVWSTPLGYLRAVPDEYTGIHNWATSFSFEELRGILEGSGRTVGSIRSVRVGQRLDNGAVDQLIFEGSDGTVYLNKNTIMDLLNLKSRWFSMGANDYLPAGPVSVIGSTASGSSHTIEFADLYVVSAQGASVIKDSAVLMSSSGLSEAKLSDLVIYDGKTTTRIETQTKQTENTSEPVTASVDSLSEEVCTNGMIYLSGVGYGHGVGICQTGMSNRAKAGQDYEQIINAYLTDIELVQHSSLGY